MSALHHLSAADLEALSSRLTLRRARRDLDASLAPQSAETTLDGVAVVWDDATCTFPDGGLAASRCTCPARRLCRHRVRSVLYLQQRAEAEAESTTPTDWSPAQWTLAALEKAAGKAVWRKALAARTEGIAVEKESQTAATIPALGIRVRFLPGLPLSEAVCSCGVRRVCAHRVLAALAWQPELPDAAAHDPAVGAVEARVWSRVVALLSAGLDGAPPEAADGLRALSQRVAQHLPEPARDLLVLADTMASYQARSARSSGRQWLWGLGRLGARLRALASPTRQQPATSLRGRSRRAHLAAGDRTVLGLGAEGFVGGRGVVVKCWFIVAETGDWAHASVGRGHTPGEEPLPPRALWRAPLWAEQAPCDVAHARVQLSGARLSPDGALSTTSVTARPQPEPVLPADLPAGVVAGSLAELAARWVQQAPPILRGQRDRWLPAVLALAEGRTFLDAPTFAEAGQVLTVPVALRDGGSVTLRLAFGADTAPAIEALERLRDWPARPTHLLVRYWPTEAGITAAPISAWLVGQPRPISLGLGPPLAPRSRKPWRTVVTATPPPTLDPPLEALQGLLDLLESLAVEGLSRGSWRLDALQSAAARLDALGLRSGATHARTLTATVRALSLHADAQLEDAAAAFITLLSWASAVEEAWMLRRVAPAV